MASPCVPGQRFSGFPAEINYTDCEQAGQAFNIQDCQQRDIQYNNQTSVRRPPGVVDPDAYVLTRATPQINFQSPDLTTILTHVDLFNGLCVDQCDFYLQQRAQCDGAFLPADAVGAHILNQILKGFIYVDSIQADQDDAEGASANFMTIPLFVPTTEGTAVNPLISQTGVVLTGAPAPSYISSFCLGPTFINGVEILGVTNVQVQPQITVQASPASPHTFNQLVSITVRETIFRIRCLKINDFNALLASSVPGYIGGAVDLYLQKADPTFATGDGRVASTVAQHIKISATDGVLDPQTQSYNGTDDAQLELILRLAGAPTVNLASVIPPSANYLPV